MRFEESFKLILRRAERERRANLEAQLPALLSRLLEDGASLTWQQWKALYHVLYERRRFSHCQHKDTVLLVLQTLQQQGETADLPYLEWWPNLLAALWAKEEGAVSEAAAACLLVLQARLEREHYGQTR